MSSCLCSCQKKDKISQIELLFQMKRKIISCTKITSFQIKLKCDVEFFFIWID